MNTVFIPLFGSGELVYISALIYQKKSLPMESEIQEQPIAPVKRTRKKKSKKETRFDRRFNWLKDHKVFSWVMIFGVVGGIVWGVLPKRMKDVVNTTIGNIHLSSNRDLDRLKTIILTYYDNVGTQKFKAADYFAPKVDEYILVKNTTPSEIDAFNISNGLEFLAPKTVLFDSTFVIEKDKSGNNVVIFWNEFNCFRKSKLKYEYCLVQMKLIFDENDKIKSYTEVEHEGLKFWNKELLFEGSVGNLAAVFNLVFDYRNQTVSGTYYYPSRGALTYDITGTIKGKTLELVEYTRGKQSATCTVSTKDDKTFNGTMFNTDGRKLNMVMRTSEFLYLEQ